MAMAGGESWGARLDARLKAIVESALFRNAITGVILVNAVILGVLTYPLPEPAARILEHVDQVIVYIFVAELLVKFAAWRLRFFQSGWNWFDLAVVAISLAPASEGFAILRALRVLRLFRLFSVMPEMRAVVEALAKAIPGMGAIMMVLLLIFYVAAVMAAKMFSGTHPEFFADLGASAFTLFQIMTLESWSMGVARPVIETHPWAWAFFVVFIILTSFAVLNLFIAVIVDSLQSKHFDQEQAAQNLAHNEREALLREMAALRADVAALREALTDQGAGGAATAAKSADKAE